MSQTPTLLTPLDGFTLGQIVNLIEQFSVKKAADLFTCDTLVDIPVEVWSSERLERSSAPLGGDRRNNPTVLVHYSQQQQSAVLEAQATGSVHIIEEHRSVDV